MFNNCYFDYYGKTKKLKNKPKVVSEIELWIDDNFEPERNIGTVFSEEHTWNNFLETDDSCSDGTTVKIRNYLMADVFLNFMILSWENMSVMFLIIRAHF